MTQRTKLSSRLLSMFLAMLMIVSMIPATVFAAPASDIPSEMLDNVYLDALAYTGYKVDKERASGRMWGSYGNYVRCSQKKGFGWLNDYALPISLIGGMAAAIPITAWLG